MQTTKTKAGKNPANRVFIARPEMSNLGYDFESGFRNYFSLELVLFSLVCTD